MFLGQPGPAPEKSSEARGQPQFLKKRSENAGPNEIFHVGSQEFRESLRELLRELWFLHCTSRETPFREWDFAFRESSSELRELLQEYPGTHPEIREWPFSQASEKLTLCPQHKTAVFSLKLQRKFLNVPCASLGWMGFIPETDAHEVHRVDCCL